MKNKYATIALLAITGMLMPKFSQAQGVAADLHSLQGVLNTLYDQMIPLCSNLIDVGRSLAGFATLWFIGSRVWRHIAAAEPIDFYPLLRPFAIGFCISIFPMVLAMINGVLSPTVSATYQMAGQSNTAVMNMLDPANQTTSGSTTLNSYPDKWYQYANPDGQTPTTPTTSSLSDQFSGWGLQNMIKKAIAELLNVLFEAAALAIDTIRTFKLIVLAILGPLCFGLSVFDGFQHSLRQWLARYINVYMWLPVANIFGAIISKIQENMITLQQTSGSTDLFFGDTNTAYLIFMVIGIVGYFTVPGIANYIVQVGGHALLNKTSRLANYAVSTTTNAIAKTSSSHSSTFAGQSGQPSYKNGQSNEFQIGKLTGKS